jgi:hypothetical protein
VYGNAEAVNNVIRQVRADYVNPNYHGYNLVYNPVFDMLMTGTALLGGNLPLCKNYKLGVGDRFRRSKESTASVESANGRMGRMAKWNVQTGNQC